MAGASSGTTIDLDAAVPTEDDIASFLAGAHRPGLATWAARRLLRAALDDFSLNGLLRTYPLYLMHTRHWRSLLGDTAGGRLLDIGAAAGDVTAELAPLFDEVVTTDTSRPMVSRLAERGFDAHHVDIATHDLPHDPFDTVALLNVLDRCDDPAGLLSAAVRACRSGGTVLISTPLPYDPWRYKGSRPVRPRRQLPLQGESFDADLAQLTGVILPGAGLTPLRWVTTPYVSAGDRRRCHYRLPAAVVVGRKN